MSASDQTNNSPDSRDVDTLARDADEQRQRIGQTLGQLEGRLSPEGIKNQAMDLFKEHGTDIADGLQRSVKNNPIPLILTGVGIAWMMMSQRDDKQRPQRQYDNQYPAFRQPQYDTRHFSSDGGSVNQSSGDSSEQGVAGKMRDAKDALVDGASDRWNSVTDSAADARDASGERLQAMRHESSAMASQAQDRFSTAAQSAGRKTDEWSDEASRFMQEQPLVAGALGIAFGALLGGLLPISDKERELAQSAVDSEAGRDALDRSRDMVASAQTQATQRIEEASRAAQDKVEDAKNRATTEA